MSKVAFITGASRGIGKAIAVKLASEGYDIVAAAKTTEPDPRLPGTIHDTVAACEALGVKGLAVKMDVRDEAQVEAGVKAAVERFGRIDAAIHNAGALWWKPILETPVRKYDLVNQVNARAAYALAHYTLPHLIKAGGGHFVTLSPPVSLAALGGKCAYLISKFGMTMVALGVAAEHGRDNVAGVALWPETAVETAATINFGLGGPSSWYKAEIVADALWTILRAPAKDYNGRALLVLDALREGGITDFTPYRCDPNFEPPILDVYGLPRAGGNERADGKSRM